MNEMESIRNELARALFSAERGSLNDAEWAIVKEHANPAHSNWIRADALLASPLIRRIQAEALRDAARSQAFGAHAESTLLNRADRIEKGASDV